MDRNISACLDNLVWQDWQPNNYHNTSDLKWVLGFNRKTPVVYFYRSRLFFSFFSLFNDHYITFYHTNLNKAVIWGKVVSHRISPAFVVSFEKWKEGTDLLEDLKCKQISALKSEPTHTHTSITDFRYMVTILTAIHACVKTARWNYKFQRRIWIFILIELKIETNWKYVFHLVQKVNGAPIWSLILECTVYLITVSDTDLRLVPLQSSLISANQEGNG